MLPDTIPERIRSGVGPQTDDGCLPWERATTQGYGITSWRGRQWRVHRLIYEIVHGAVPDDLGLDHLCCSPEWCAGGDTCPHRRCANPDHLTPATTGQNVLRGNSPFARHARQTHCIRDHEFTPENTTVRGGRRWCKQCIRDRSRQAYDKRVGPHDVAPEKRTHCPAKHPYDEINTYVDPRGNRQCRECRRKANRRFHAVKKAGTSCFS